MSETLLEEMKIGDVLSMGVEMEDEEIGLFIASADVSASCGFRPDEWERFVEGVGKAHERYLEGRRAKTGNK